MAIAQAKEGADTWATSKLGPSYRVQIAGVIRMGATIRVKHDDRCLRPECQQGIGIGT